MQLLLPLVFLASGCNTPDDLKLLQGVWIVAAVEVDGGVKGGSPKQLTITGDKLEGWGPEMTLALDSSKRPKCIDLTFKKGDSSFPIHAIYSLTENELSICMPVAQPGVPFDNKRPDSFETKGKQVALLKAKRQ